MLNGLGNILSWLNPASENFFLKDVVEWLKNFLEYFNPGSEKFILKIVIDFLNPTSENFFGKKLIELLNNALTFLFVPSEERLNAIPNAVKSKFAFVESIKTAITSFQDILNGVGNSPVLTVNIKPTKYTPESTVRILDFSWYAPYKPYGDVVLTGFIYAMFIWRVFVILPGIISGAAGSVDNYTSIQNMLNGGKK